MTSTKSPYRGKKPEWADFTDKELLEMRFCDLGLRIRDTVFPGRLERLHRELARKDIRFRPHAWLSLDWFSPDGITGFAVPFYLAHPRLMLLEKRQVFEVEGANENWCMRLFRHETGHAIDSAYRLRRRKRWRQLFGSATRKYPEFYRPRPLSRRFVRHLDAWYAQSHPTEDFAETFAVWLQPGSRWRRHYQEWPAFKKLEYVDELMGEIAGTAPPVRNREHLSPLSEVKMTLGQYYDKKRSHFSLHNPGVPDMDLLRLFSREGSRKKASAFLRRVRSGLRSVVARGTGEHAYIIDQILKEMILRCRELNLVVDRPEEDLKLEAAVLLSVRTITYLQKSGRQWIPL